MQKKLSNKNAFTLIELLVVIAVISILATVLVILINPVEITRRSNDARRFSDMEMIKSAIDLAASDGQIIPNTGVGFITLDGSVSVNDIDPSATNTFDLQKYLPSIPTDPSYNSSGASKGLVLSGSGECIQGEINNSDMSYKLWGNGTTYILRSNMQSTTNCETLSEDGNDNATYEIGTDPGLDEF